MGRPLISVLVAVYNSANYLERCIASIRAQTLTDLEILCVDDGSSDDSPAILARLARQDSRIVVLTHDRNRGLGAARNTAIAAARADYVGAVDTDDTIAPEMMRRLWEGSRGGHFDLVVCGFRRVDATGHVLGKGMDRVATYERLDESVDRFRLVNPAFWNKLWRRSIYIDNKIRFPENIFYEDGATTPIFMMHARHLNLIGGDDYFYLQRPGSIVNSFSDRHIVDFLHVLDNVKQAMIANDSYHRHKDRFDGYVTEQLMFLERQILLNRTLCFEEKQQRLRHVRMLKSAYIVFDDMARQNVVKQEYS